MESPDTFALQPISVDPSTKAVSTTSTSDNDLQAELAILNTVHRSMVGLETPNSVPPPPVPVNPKRSQQIQKLRESGNASMKKNNYDDAIRMYSLAIEMAAGRPHWEPQGLVREEVSALYANRSQARISQREWPDGLVDAEASLEMKSQANPKAWWRKAKCLLEMGRLEEAEETLRRGLEFEEEPADLQKLQKEVLAALEKRS